MNSCIVVPHNGLGMCKYISIYNYDYLFDDKYNYLHRVKRYLKN